MTQIEKIYVAYDPLFRGKKELDYNKLQEDKEDFFESDFCIEVHLTNISTYTFFKDDDGWEGSKHDPDYPKFNKYTKTLYGSLNQLLAEEKQ